MAGLRYVFLKDGPASSNGVETVSYFDPDDLSALPTIQCYHMPLILKDGLSPVGTRGGMTFEIVVFQPKSRGLVKLGGSDPEAMPLIDPNYMAEPDDLALAIKSIRTLRQVMQMPSLSELLEPELVPGLHLQTDKELGDWIKTVVTTMWHPVGTCRMDADANAVVDAHLRVNGIDCESLMHPSCPCIVSGNTSAPTMTLADRGADVFLADKRAVADSVFAR